LTASVGIGLNKFVAKLASEQAKPDGLLTIEPDQVCEFLAPLPVTALWGVGEATAGNLRRLGFATIGQLQQCDTDELVAQFGTQGRRLAELARGHDDSPIQTDRERKSVSHEQTFPEDTKDRQVTIKLRFSDFHTITRSTTLTEPTNSDQQIYRSASGLLDAINLAKRNVRLVGVAVSNLYAGEQPQLLVPPSSRESEVDRAIDAVRERFGTDSVRRARLVDKDFTDSPSED